MSNDVRNIIISRFISNVYNGTTKAQEANYFLTNRIGIKSIDFAEDGQVTIINKDNKIETYFYQGEINVKSKNK